MLGWSAGDEVLGATPRSLSELRTLSVVLPCANEQGFVSLTVESVFNATPAGLLSEIVVVDDASRPAVSEELSEDFLARHRARIIRHDTPQGLIRAKKDGGDAARGDVIVFLDCHVRPMERWTEPIIEHLRQNPRRIVVPEITSLDPDTWQEVSTFGGGTKMCLTWNADFGWCNWYPGPYVPVMSGGLLALTRFWWQATGGYDDQMLSWGGENLDQSMRTWLCGGEILVATGSRVAHMWRDPSKPKTMLRYAIPADHVRRNRLRAAEAWLGPWADKVRGFSEFEDFRPGGRLEVGDLSSMRRAQAELGCEGFGAYLERFQDLYLSTGMLPESVFHLREATTGLCLHLRIIAHRPEVKGGFELRPCSLREEMQWLHLANRADTGGCCSGLQVWNTGFCVAVFGAGGPVDTLACEADGDVPAQQLSLRDGQLVWQDDSACIAPEDFFGLRARAPAAGGEAPKAAFRRGSACGVVVEDDAASGGFRLVSADAGGQRRCLSLPSASTPEAAHGAELRFLPCEAAPREASVFQRWRAHGDGRHQIRMLHEFCLDASSGWALIAYLCHLPEHADPNQLFGAVHGQPLRWDARAMQHHPDFCVDIDRTAPVVLAPCATAAEADSAAPGADAAAHGLEASRLEAPKVGQGFVREGAGEEAVLREVPGPGGEEARCLTRDMREGQQALLVAACDGGASQRWRLLPADGGFHSIASSVEEDLCIDASSERPSLVRCTGGVGQRFLLGGNGWIEAQRYWADNGRSKLPRRCLDSRPEPRRAAISASCAAARRAGVAWERLWAETPVETRLFHEARAER